MLYLKEQSNENNGMGCQSLILASAPTSASLIQGESKRLYREIAGISSEQEEQHEDPASKQQHTEAFRQTHECRLVHTPLALMDALAQAGPTSWRGIPAIADYKVSEVLSSMQLPTLVLTGEYDFCTPACVEGWKDVIPNPAPKEVVLTNCSHYGMLEDERQYGKAITEFLLAKDNKEN